jgi:molybdopterin molybdotransferase
MQASTYPMLDFPDAASTVLNLVSELPSERVELAAAPDRVLAVDLVADKPLPAFPVSSVDGYAIRAQDGGGRLRVVGESPAGQPFAGVVPSGGAARVLTGALLPEGADTVVMIEDVEVLGSDVIVPSALRRGSGVHLPGDDLRAGEVVVRRGQLLGPADVGLAAALGQQELDVRRRPRVALLSTGDELVEVGGQLGPGQIFDSNRWALFAALIEAGAEVESMGIAPDQPGPLRALVEAALERNDVLVTSGGVSVGTYDLVKPLLEELGQVHVGRVRIRPGRPFTFASLPRGRLAFGLPGFPVASLVTFETLVRPALRKMQGHEQLHRPTFRVRLAYDAHVEGDRLEFQRVTLHWQGDELVAETTGSQSSSRLMSLVGAHALVKIEPGRSVAAGSMVPALILALPAA